MGQQGVRNVLRSLRASSVGFRTSVVPCLLCLFFFDFGKFRRLQLVNSNCSGGGSLNAGDRRLYAEHDLLQILGISFTESH